MPKRFQLLLVFSISAQGIHCLIAGSTPVRLRHVSRLQQVWSRSRKIHEFRLSQSRHQVGPSLVNIKNHLCKSTWTTRKTQKKYQQALCKGSQASWPLSANCNNSWTLSLSTTALTCQLVNYKHFVNIRSKVTSLNHLLYRP